MASTPTVRGRETCAQDTTVQLITSIRGLKMRVDAIDGQQHHHFDPASGKMFLLHPEKREADAYDIAKIAADLEGTIPIRRVSVTMTPTGGSETILGVKCRETKGNIRAVSRLP